MVNPPMHVTIPVSIGPSQPTVQIGLVLDIKGRTDSPQEQLVHNVICALIARPSYFEICTQRDHVDEVYGNEQHQRRRRQPYIPSLEFWNVDGKPENHDRRASDEGEN